MINIEVLGKYQQHLLDINSADYKYGVLTNCIEYINELINHGEFRFLNISDDVTSIYTTNNYFYDYLENKLTYKVNNEDQYYNGYNKLNIEALLYGINDPNPNFIIHDEIYANLDNIYKNFFSNISEYSVYSVFYNNFKINTLSPSNYLKVCFNKERENLQYKIANFYIVPIYEFSKICAPQVLTAVRREIYDDTFDGLLNSTLVLNNLSDLNSSIAVFILKNIFNDFNFNASYEKTIQDSVNISELSSIFNNYIESLPEHNILLCINNIYLDFIQEFSYILMTKGRERDLIRFDTPEDIYKNSIFRTELISYEDDPIIFNFLEIKEIPEIFYLIDDDNFLISFNNINYRVNRAETKDTFARLVYKSNNTGSFDSYDVALLDKFVTYASNGNKILAKTRYTKNILNNIANQAVLLKKSETQKVVPKNSIYKTLINDILKRIDDMRSIVTLTYKYRKEPLQFINSNLAAFSDWLDLILESQYNNIDYVDVLDKEDILSILNSIVFSTRTKEVGIDPDDASDRNTIYKLLDFIHTNFFDLFYNSKVIELNTYNYFGQLVDKFINTQEFKSYILIDFIEPIAKALKTRSPKLYKEIYQNIDNIINYIKFLLIKKLYNDVDLNSKYRDILLLRKSQIISRLQEFTDYDLGLLIADFQSFDDYNIILCKNASIKFTTSMAMLFLLDKYIDGFRILKKYKTYNIENVEYDRLNRIVTIHLDDIHNLEQGRGVTILGNSGNINGYKIVYSPEDRGTKHFTFYQPDAKPGMGGSINIKRR